MHQGTTTDTSGTRNAKTIDVLIESFQFRETLEIDTIEIDEKIA